jgi:hypothetical protein
MSEEEAIQKELTRTFRIFLTIGLVLGLGLGVSGTVLVTSAEERSNLRAAAIDLGKCGLTADDVAPMAEAYYRAKWRAEG